LSTDKKKLSVVFTGGTIAMVEGRDGVLRPPADPREFSKAVPQIFEERTISINFALNKDSTDMMPEDWQIIAEAVKHELNTQKPDGIIVVHGVDTICFTASAVAYALGPALDCPIVFTGAQLPADKIHGDGLINLLRSAEIAACKDEHSRVKEVMILFNTRAFRACRAQKHDDKDFDALVSPAFPPLVLVKDPLEINSRKKEKVFMEDEYTELKYMNKFATGILPIPLSPGNLIDMNLKAMESDQCNGIILFSFGGHTIPMVKEQHDYLPLIERANEKSIPVLLTSHYPTTTTKPALYDSGTAADNAGAIPVGGYVLPALIAKFSWVLAHTEHISAFEYRHKVISTIMSKPYIGEIGEDFSDKEIWNKLKELKLAQEPSLSST
jgi:L-asparaginase